ncbi:MAG: LacI family transcriptional regulator [Clostridiales bacterium]|nr:LacI family transcriptional regulator [Clostridiales bacterium]
MKPTIRDVAQKAGVSVGTVSRYLNGLKLREHNRIKVEKAIKELNFKENIIAKGLKNNRSMTIGVVIVSLTDIFGTSIVTALERTVEKENYSIILCDYENDLDRLKYKLQFLRDRSVDALVLFPSIWPNEITESVNDYLRDDIPVVVIDDDFPTLETDKILVDNMNASFQAVEKLIKMGHKRIGIINGQKNSYTSKERYAGYLKALQKYQIDVDEDIIKWGNYSNHGGYSAAKKMLLSYKPPTAIFATNYYMTLGAIAAVQELNISIPRELSIIGFDRFPLSEVIKPTLTLIEQPASRMGRLAGQIILRRLKGDYSDFPIHQQVPTKLLIRDSISSPINS